MRSLLEARPILQEGMGWRVGNGHSVNIWADKWIMGVVGMKPLINHSNQGLSFVSSLIDSDLYCWKINLVKKLFLPFEVEAILRLPISFWLPHDVSLWTLTKETIQ